MKLSALIYPGFELLDLYGPLEMFSIGPTAFELKLVAQTLHPVAGTGGPRTQPDADFDAALDCDVLLVPGCRKPGEVDDSAMLPWIREASKQAQYTLSVCTGAYFLAQAGILTGRKATTNKMLFDWVVDHTRDLDIGWQRRARWVADESVFTSSGVSAGTDMALGFVAHLHDHKTACHIARIAEYVWDDNPDDDLFA